MVVAGLVDRAEGEALGQDVGEGQAVAADSDCDDVGVLVEARPLDLGVHGGPAALGGRTGLIGVCFSSAMWGMEALPQLTLVKRTSLPGGNSSSSRSTTPG